MTSDWEWLYDAAVAHGVVPLLSRHLGALPSKLLPGAVRRRLRDQAEHSGRRSLLLTGELVKLVSVFEANAIPMLSLKGPTLAAAAYGDLALREFLDLDVLVQRCDVARATQVLLSNGYRPRNSMSDAQQAAVRRQSCELGFARDDGTRLDLHWDLMPPFFSVSLDHRALWQRRETVSVGGATVPALATEDLLLFLCVHGTKHLWARLQWLCDVAELQRRSADLDIATLLTRARALGAERMVLLALALTADVLDAPVADGVRRRAQQDRNVSALATQVRARWFRHAALTPIDPRELHLFRLRARERWRDRWRYLRLAVAPGPADLTWLRLPDALHLLYYVLRPIRLAVRYGVRRRPVR